MFSHNMTLCVEDPHEPARKLLKPRNKFSKVQDDKINRQMSIVFLHTLNEQSENEIKPFYLK
jgi:hypothetical protein